MRTRRILSMFAMGWIVVGLLSACSASSPAAEVGTATAVSPTTTPTPASSDSSQQAADTVSRFLQSLMDDSSGTSSLDDLSPNLRAVVESGDLLTTILGIDQMYRSFGVKTLQVDANKGQAVVEAGLNEVSPVTRDFILTEEAGNWLINTILSYGIPSLNLPDNRIDSAQVIIDYFQALEDGRLTDALALLSPSAQTKIGESGLNEAANEIEGITTTSLKLIQASPDTELYSGTFWTMPNADDPGNWTTGSNTRWIELTHTADGWRIDQVSSVEITTAVPTPSSTPTATSSPAPCTLTANSDVPLYNRPDTNSSQFGIFSSGQQAVITGQAPGGWLGFDPGVAQAANVGIFRLRWLAPGSDTAQSGSCDALTPYPAISPTACYEMAMADTPIYAQPDDTAVVITTLPGGGYTAVTGKSAQNWVQVDLSDGSLADNHSGQTGWITPNAANFNGQSCTNLPVVNP